jgi:hypothetical protein
MFTRIDLGAWALLLIAMGIGYFVLLKASKEGSKLFRYGGYIMGIIILVVSLSLAVSDVGVRISRRAMSGRTRRITTRPTTIPQVEIPRLPLLPRKAVGVTEPQTVMPKAGE